MFAAGTIVNLRDKAVDDHRQNQKDHVNENVESKNRKLFHPMWHQYCCQHQKQQVANEEYTS